MAADWHRRPAARSRARALCSLSIITSGAFVASLDALRVQQEPQPLQHVRGGHRLFCYSPLASSCSQSRRCLVREAASGCDETRSSAFTSLISEADELRSRLACLVDAPACALVASPCVRSAGVVLSRLAADGRLGDIAEEALGALRAGDLLTAPGKLDWDRVSKFWPQGAEHRATFDGVARLLSIGTNDAVAVTVLEGRSYLPGSVEVRRGGRTERISLTDVGSAWGPLGRLRVDAGPSELLGRHLVAWWREDGAIGAGFYRSRAEIAAGRGDSNVAFPGDILYLSGPDRAAFLEIATFDRMPISVALVRDEDFSEVDGVGAGGGTEFQEARSFAASLRGLNEGDARAARLSRLLSHPILRQVAYVAERDGTWAPALEVLAPMAPAAYQAAEARLPAFWTAPSRLGPGLEGQQVLVLVAASAAVVLGAAVLLVNTSSNSF